jgi:hypothetical protein
LKLIYYYYTMHPNKRFLQKLPPMSKPKICIEPEKKQTSEKEVKKKSYKKNNRCGFDGCKKKLHITSVECRCNKKFCNKHFLAEKHNCTFDYKKNALDNLIKRGHLDGCTSNTLTDKL